jgi:hypothetical protein
MKSRNPFGMLKMAPLGMKMLKTGRLSFKRESIKNKKQLQALLRAIKEEVR